jgi:hypothetical protein
MAIDFNKNLVFDPKIEIVGKEVPLAALEKTGNILQDRYDKSYENYSMADEALKQMEASANPVDREKAKELRGIYNQEMQGILQKGDFHNMRQQTASLARNAAVNYKTIAEKNAKIQAELDAIAKNPKYILDPEGAAQDYLKNLKSISINPETKTISDFNVGTYNAPADVDEMKWAITYGAVMKPTIDKVKGTSIVPVDKFGKETNDQNQVAMLMVKTSSGQLVELKPEDLQKTLLPAAYADPNIQARLNRDTKRAGYDPNTEEGKVYKEKLFNEQTLPAIGAAAGLLRRKEDMSADGVVFKDIPKADGDVSGGGRKRKSLDKLLVTNTEISGEDNPDLLNPTSNVNAPADFVQKAILGNVSGFKSDLTKPQQKIYFNTLLDAMDYNISKAKTDEEKNRFIDAKNMFKEFKQLTEDFPEYKRTLSEIVTREPASLLQNISDKALAGIENLKSIFADPARTQEFQQRVYTLGDKYRNYMGQWFKDSDIEDGIEDYLKAPKESVSTAIPMLAPGIKDEALQKAFAYMGNVFNNTNTEVYKQSEGFDIEKPFEFRKVATAPRGNGTGILFEVQQKDKDGKIQTALVEPNYEGKYDILESVEDAIYESTGKEISLVNANRFKNVRPFSRVGEKRTVQDIFDEAELGKVNPRFADIEIQKTKKGYQIVGSNTPFDSYIEAVMALLP